MIESLFNVSSSNSSTIVGALALVGGAGSMLVGGMIVSRYDLDVRGIIKVNIAASIVALMCCAILFKSCPDTVFGGVNTLTGGGGALGEITAPCNLKCACSKETYDPVCGDDDVTYFSGCFAGCQGRSGDTFSNCSCVLGASQGSRKGKCESLPCGHGGKYVYLFIMFVFLFFSFLIAVPSIQITLRVVPFSQRTFAIGFQWLLVRVLATIPGPLLYGYQLDRYCVLSADHCGDESSCEVYRNKDLSFNIFITTFVIKLIGFISVCAVYYLYEPVDTPAAAATDEATPPPPPVETSFNQQQQQQHPDKEVIPNGEINTGYVLDDT